MEPRGVFIVVFFVVSQGLGKSAANGPHIHGPEERTVPSGSNFTLVCSGTGPFQWIYQNSTSTNFKIDSTQTESEFTMIDSNYLDTGSYECVSREGKVSVYVFVSDDDNLLALESDTFLPAIQGQNITIPCKPTALDVQVDLYHDGKPVDPKFYRPTTGYTFFFSGLNACCDYECVAQKGNRTVSRDIVLWHQNACEGPPIPEIVESFQPAVIDEQAIFTCTVLAESGSVFEMEWIVPEHVKEPGKRISMEEEPTCSLYQGTSFVICSKNLTIDHVLKEDEGNYTCRVTDHCFEVKEVTHHVRVHPKGYSFINLTVHSNLISVLLAEDAVWVVDLQAYPDAKIGWFDSEGRELIQAGLERKYRLENQESERVLTIRNVTFSDAGNYSVVATNVRGNRQELQLHLLVFGQPSPEIYDLKRLYEFGLPANVTCRAVGYPTPEIQWSYKKCDAEDEQDCQGRESVVIKEKLWSRQITDTHIESGLEWPMEDSVILTCTASNEEGTHKDAQAIRVTDVPDGYRMTISQSEVVAGDNVSLSCSVSTYEYHGKLQWYKDHKIAEESKAVTTARHQKHSFTTSLLLVNINKTQSGEYVCEATTLTNQTVTKQIKIQVLDAVRPSFGSGTNLTESEVILSEWMPIVWRCEGKGVPTPTITWYKDDEILTEQMASYELLDNNQTLVIKRLTLQEAGQYVCIVENKVGREKASTLLILKGNNEVFTYVTIAISVTATVFIIGLVLYIIKIKRQEMELNRIGLVYFRSGMQGDINPDLPLEEQTNLLPYDEKWEFPRKGLILGKQLGAGAFGMVVQAEAFGISKKEPSTTVAVKMAKHADDPSYIKALASELKILIHLGKHLNVVNLLGACTKNLAKRELLVIVEYCKYGNIQDYILKNKSVFINEIDPETGEIDSEKSRINYASLMFPCETDCCCEETKSSASASADSATTTLDYRLCGSTCSNLKQDWYPVAGNDTTDSISTSTLLSWSFQVARGMEYLTSRRVLHGDLAARNVLLAENNIVKICDFGLAKNIYRNPEYKKTGVGLLPVKWMAIESLSHRVFSTQSDVWSFGIVLWELFSLSATPYPGIQEADQLLSQLIAGYRLPKPQYATRKLYEVMLECWTDIPTKRPTFSDLVNKLGSLMETNVSKHYIEVHASNKDGFVHQEDYCSMFSPPLDNGNDYVDYRVSNDEDDPQSQSNYLDDTCLSKDVVEMTPVIPRNGDDYEVARTQPVHSAFNPCYLFASKIEPMEHQLSIPVGVDIMV